MSKESTFEVTMTMLVDAVTADELRGLIDNQDASHIVSNMATDIHVTFTEVYQDE